ncbi:MAG: hydrogenase nickel incorporation protein HypB [Pseudomonadota bacterium]
MSPENTRKVGVVTNILAANERVADENRRTFAQHGLCVINLISSPGAGKTTLLEKTLPVLAEQGIRAAVIVGDIATTRDADRLAVHGVPVVQIMTEAFGGSCHLEASTIRMGMEQIDLSQLDLLFVENIGNLVCPAEFDLGERAKVALLSVTEGEDKPLKYPLAFQVSQLALITKVDLAPHLDFDMDALRANLDTVNPRLARIELSSRRGTAMDAWLAWLQEQIAASRG